MRQKGNKGSMLSKNQGNNENELQWPKLEQPDNRLNNKNTGL